LQQLISEPTRMTDRSATLIDLIFTNETRNIAKSGVIHNGMSDHSLIYVVMSAKKSSIRNKFLYFMQEWPLKRYKCWISQAVFLIKKVFISNNIKVKLCILFNTFTFTMVIRRLIEYFDHFRPVWALFFEYISCRYPSRR
jgi:hypothetical protein